MMKKLIVPMTLFLGLCITHACKKDSNSSSDPKGTLSGSISNSNSATVSGATVIVFNANTNLPVASLSTDSNGSYSIQLAPGSYYVKIYAQGYQSIPLPGLTAVPLQVNANSTTAANFQMNNLTVANAGLISGKVATSSGSAVSGVLVVAHWGSNGYSSVSDDKGNYTIYNVPAGNYTVEGYIAAYNSDSVNTTVVSGSNPASANLTLTAGAPGSVSGMVTFLATANKEVDISIINPYTKESIPGLTTTTVHQTYSLSNVPNGYYIARASYKNDAIVMDPDWILKNGQPTVTVSNSAATVDFSVTGSVLLNSPTNDPSSTAPFKISGTSATFTWTAYPSTSDYAVEVDDENGNVIWGGFSGSGSAITRNVTVPASQTSIQYNSDGKGQALQAGHYYRWKIYACKNTVDVPSWKLISASEDQMGLIIP